MKGERKAKRLRRTRRSCSDNSGAEEEEEDKKLPPVIAEEEDKAAAVVVVVVDDENDDEVEIVSPPPSLLSSLSSNENENENDDDDDEVLFVGSNGKNALSDYPHSRENCVVHRFQQQTPKATSNNNTNSNTATTTTGSLNNEMFCENCYCYVCDIPASNCCNNKDNAVSLWSVHCNACHDVKKWQKLRQKTIREKNDKKLQQNQHEKEQSSSSSRGGLLSETTRNYYRRLQPSKYEEQKNKRYGILPFGTDIILKGLINKPELNDDRGEILHYDTNANGSGRYIVYIYKYNENSTSSGGNNNNNNIILKVKPINILQINLKVTIHGIKSKTSLNGLYATIQGWDSIKQRYYINIIVQNNNGRRYITTTNNTNANVNTNRTTNGNANGNNSIVSDDNIISVKPSNIVYAKRTIVQIVQLPHEQQELNGQWGTVVDFIDYGTSGRYDIHLSSSSNNNKIVRVKLDNVRV
jgi:hypothetical protein